MRYRSQQGQAALELAVCAVPLVLLAFLVVYAARLPQAQARVDEAAQAAARAASASNDRDAARQAATTAAQASLADLGVTCRSFRVDIDLAAYHRGGTVTAAVHCVVDQSDLAVLGVGGSRTITGRFTSTVDAAGTAS